MQWTHKKTSYAEVSHFNKEIKKQKKQTTHVHRAKTGHNNIIVKGF